MIPGRIKNLDRDAAKLIKAIARIPGDHRALARKFSEKWNLVVNAAPEKVETAPIKTFADAKQQGTDLMPELEGVYADVDEFRKQLRAPGMIEREQVQEQLDAAEEQLSATANRCLSVFDRALVLADSSTVREDVNQIRYLQSVCHYMLKRYFESALIGEFLVDRYPTIAYSRQAGGIAIRSYAMLYGQADSDDKTFEKQRLISLAKKIVDRWPGSAESIRSASTLANLILSKKNITDEDVGAAQIYIEQVPASAPERSRLNIELGTDLWFAYQKKKHDGAESEEQLADRLQTAIDYLSKGTKSYNSGNLTIKSAWASLYLVDALLASGDIDVAVAQLETASIAPIDLVKQKNKIVFRSGTANQFVGRSYKTAGKTYLAAMSKNPDDRQWLEKAIEVVRAMRSRADQNSDEKAKQDVVKMYRLIASQMERQFEAMEDPNEQKKFAENLTRFLETIQAESSDANTIIWAGRTLMHLADSFTSQSMDAEAKTVVQHGDFRIGTSLENGNQGPETGQ